MVELKKIESKEKKEAKRRKYFIIMAIVIALVMVFSTFANSLITSLFNSEGGSVSSDITYKGTKFIKDPSSGYWQFTVLDKVYMTRYNPNELNETKSNLMISLATYQDQVLSFEWNESQDGALEVRRNLEGNAIPKRVNPKVCLSNECPGNYPIKDCENDLVISFKSPKEGENERVYKENNCVFIVANTTNQVRYADAFLYNLLGIN